jgi:hypothetical protein
MVVVSYSKWRCCLSSFFRPGAWFRHIYFSIPVRFDRPIELNPCGLSLSYRPGQPLWLGITKWGGRIFSKWRQTLFSVCELMKNVYLTYSRHFLTTCTTHSIHSFDTFQVSSRLRNAPKTSSHAGHQVGTAGCRKKKVLVLPFLCGSVSRCWRGLLHVCVCLFSFSRVSFFSLDGQRLCQSRVDTQQEKKGQLVFFFFLLFIKSHYWEDCRPYKESHRRDGSVCVFHYPRDQIASSSATGGGRFFFSCFLVLFGRKDFFFFRL